MKSHSAHAGLLIGLLFTTIFLGPATADSIPDSPRKSPAQDTAILPGSADMQDGTFPSKEYVTRKYPGMDGLNQGGLAFLEYDAGLKLKSLGGAVFEVDFADENADSYGPLFSERERIAIRSINRDFRVANILMTTGMVLLLVDMGHLFYQVGRSLNGHEVSSGAVAGVTWLGLGISTGLEVGGFSKKIQGRRKFFCLVNRYNSNQVPKE